MNIIRELRKKKGIQQKELAKIIGVSGPTVSEWEANKKDPSGERLRRLAAYFGVDEIVILGKNVVDLTKPHEGGPITPEAKILAAGIDRMSQADRERAFQMMMLMFQATDYFEKKGHDDDEGQT